MSPLHVLSVFGTRPEAVKMAPVLQKLAATPDIELHVCVTAQHREMLDQVMSLFGIRPEIDLDLMRPNQSLAALTASIFTSLDPVLEKMKPDWVLVQGDTTTVMATALASYYRRIHVGHVEAGLRTHDRWQPFPEEINRRVASVVADLHFAPTEHARQNLLHEGIPDRCIAVTGNTVIDALGHDSVAVPAVVPVRRPSVGKNPHPVTALTELRHQRQHGPARLEDFGGRLDQALVVGPFARGRAEGLVKLTLGEPARFVFPHQPVPKQGHPHFLRGNARHGPHLPKHLVHAEIDQHFPRSK